MTNGEPPKTFDWKFIFYLLLTGVAVYMIQHLIKYLSKETLGRGELNESISAKKQGWNGRGNLVYRLPILRGRESSRLWGHPRRKRRRSWERSKPPSERGADTTMGKNFVAYTSGEMTKRYTHLSEEYARKALDFLNELREINLEDGNKMETIGKKRDRAENSTLAST